MGRIKKIKEPKEIKDDFINETITVKRNNYIIKVFVESLTDRFYNCRITQIVSGDTRLKENDQLQISTSEIKYYKVAV